MSALILTIECRQRRFGRSFRNKFCRARRGKSVHVRNGRPYFAQANDQRLNFLGRKIGQQSLFALEGGLNDLVVEILTRARQLNKARAIIVRVRNRCCQSLFVESIKAPAYGAFIQADSVDDTVGADVRKTRQYTHHTPLGNADAEVFSVGVGCATREFVRDISEEVRNVSFEVEHLATIYRDGSPTNIFLHKQRSEIDQEKAVALARDAGLRGSNSTAIA